MQFGLSLHKLDTRGILPVPHRLLEKRLVFGAELIVDLIGNDAVRPDPLQTRCGGPPASRPGHGGGRADDSSADAGGRGAVVAVAAVVDVVAASVMAASSAPVGEEGDVRDDSTGCWETVSVG